MIDLSSITKEKIHEVVRPNLTGTLSGHAAGEPFEKVVYNILKEIYPNNIFKQYEFLNDLYKRNLKYITVEQRNSLFNSPTMLYLLSRGDTATKEWSIDNIFEEKQNDTADILYNDGKYFELLDVKTRNKSKNAQAPNIISAYKLARTCALMIDNNDFENIEMRYIEVDWKEDKANNKLECVGVCWRNLFQANPSDLYINWAAAMQIQFHVCDLDQSWKNSRENWCRAYLKHFVDSAKDRCDTMRKKYIDLFLPYITSSEEEPNLFSQSKN